jgi:hypothetical protein
MKTVTGEQVGTAELGLPPRVQEALGELVSSAKEGLHALSVGVGLGVLVELMEEEVCEVVGPKGKHDPERTAVRHGHETGEVTLGGRRVQVERPRVRSADGERELPLRTYQHFADRDPFSRHVLEQLLAGVSTRRFERTREPVGAEVEAVARSTSRSSVSREFVARTRENLLALMSRRLDDVRLAVLILDGIELKRRCCVVALRRLRVRGPSAYARRDGPRARPRAGGARGEGGAERISRRRMLLRRRWWERSRQRVVSRSRAPTTSPWRRRRWRWCSVRSTHSAARHPRQ